MTDFTDLVKEVVLLHGAQNEEETPYKTRYEARDLLTTFLNSQPNYDEQDLEQKESCAIASLLLGCNYFETEELTAARKVLVSANIMFVALPNRLKLSPYVIETCNLIGSLYLRLGEMLKGFNYFRRAQIWYQEARNQIADAESEPPTTLFSKVSFWEEVEKQYTTTVFSLAQAYQPINQPHLAGLYASETMSRQINLQNSFVDEDSKESKTKFDLSVWVRNCSALSAFYSKNDLELSAEYLLFAALVVARSNPVLKDHDLNSPMLSGTATTDEKQIEILNARELIGHVQRDLALHFMSQLRISSEMIADPILHGKQLANKMLIGLRPSPLPPAENPNDAESNGKLPISQPPITPGDESDAVIKNLLRIMPRDLEKSVISGNAFNPVCVTVETLDVAANPDAIKDFFEFSGLCDDKIARVCATSATKSCTLTPHPVLGGFFVPPIVLPETIHSQTVSQMTHYRKIFLASPTAPAPTEGEDVKMERAIDSVWPVLFATIIADHCAKNKIAISEENPPPTAKEVDTCLKIAKVYDDHPWLARNASQVANLHRLTIHFSEEALKHLIVDGWTSDNLELHLMQGLAWRYMANMEVDAKRWKMIMNRRALILQTKVVESGVNFQAYLRFVRQALFELGHCYHELHEMTLTTRPPLTAGRPCWVKREEVVRTRGKPETIPECTQLDEKTAKMANEFATKCATAYGAFCATYVLNNKLDLDEDNENTYLTAKLSEARMYLKIGLTREEKVKAVQTALSTYRFIKENVFDKRPHMLSDGSSFKDEARLTAEMIMMLPRRLAQM
eukprot:GDKJ01031844.1.p1 GENE.GDKJ01031844.1~~GDKJ01031844.1.p1  ORF type:complete len:795 (-),score=166.42 GDKJ01031844.1:44-2428(-)